MDLDFFTYEKRGENLVPIGAVPTLLAEQFRENEHYFWLDSGGENPPCYFYTDEGVYRRISRNQFLGEIKKYIEAVAPQLVRMRDIVEVYNLLITDRGRTPISALNANQNIINFAKILQKSNKVM